MRRLPPASFDLVMTSPPYNIGKEYERLRSMDAYIEWITPIAAQCVRVLRPGGSLCWQVGTSIRGRAKQREVLPLDFVFYPMFTALGLALRERIVWHFNHGLHNKHSFSGRHEMILWFTKGSAPGYSLAQRHLAGVWNMTNVKHNHPEKTAHPCQFPEELVARLMLELTEPGQRVLDPFGGSGTVGAVARRYGRNAQLIELDRGYCDIALDRIKHVIPEVRSS